jgi:hypothetical protein
MESIKLIGHTLQAIMKMNKTTQFLFAVVVMGFVGITVLAEPSSEWVSCTLQSGGSGSGCPGAYTGFAKMTNSVGTFWITPPTNVTSGTLTDMSGFPSPYVSVAFAEQKSDLKTWCDTNSVTFPAINSTSYELFVYVKSTPPPPTNGQPMNLQIVWQTN